MPLCGMHGEHGDWSKTTKNALGHGYSYPFKIFFQRPKTNHSSLRTTKTKGKKRRERKEKKGEKERDNSKNPKELVVSNTAIIYSSLKIFI